MVFCFFIIWYNKRTDELLYSNEEEILSIRLLSSGFWNLLGMVFDISFRMADSVLKEYMQSENRDPETSAKLKHLTELAKEKICGSLDSEGVKEYEKLIQAVTMN